MLKPLLKPPIETTIKTGKMCTLAAPRAVHKFWPHPPPIESPIETPIETPMEIPIELPIETPY